MKYIFRGHTIFEYKPEAKFDKVIQGKVNDAIPALMSLLPCGLIY